VRALLDTHILVDLASGSEATWVAELEEHRLVVSPMSAAELGCLVRLGRIRFDQPVDRWFERAVAALDAEVCALGAGLLARSQAFPWTHRDPADRVLVQTLRETTDAVLYTRDREILTFAEVEGLAVRDCRP
jgi:PIN domain nuclease of toxin-antitoxin system